MSPNPRERLYGPHEDRAWLREDLKPARGLLLGVVIGLALWAAVLGLAWLVMVLA